VDGTTFRFLATGDLILLLSGTFFCDYNKKMKGILESRNRQDALYNILVFMAYVILLTFFMRFLWNGTLVKHISILKPVDTLLQTFLLSLGIAMFKL
jgi:hypothetical protein